MDRVVVRTGKSGRAPVDGGRSRRRVRPRFFVEPTAILTDSTRTRAARDEIFGPFATFLVFDTPKGGLSIANNTRVGLASYVWTRDMKLGLRCAREIEAGLTWVNTPIMRELRAPLGGRKQRGIGAEGAGLPRLLHTGENDDDMPLRLFSDHTRS